ncbi:Aste57867_1643 [Aphanomyces stellatus]|uniref:Aste57867_1643 protein n=1 Tax=Aphanomyces stellatus TaxID=120398 RepID=A0A485KAV3_9STRA|nr:hypothetical protein As57867_001641 [Aphanomyces stellatus]VFT78856.1 Aste57867_1643 [Aphanomyces stellatus]
MAACCCTAWWSSSSHHAPRRPFTFDDIPNLASKVAIVTGASAGLGLVTARELARQGCHVIFACRSREKTLTVLHTLVDALPPTARVEFMPLNLMSLRSVLAFVDAFKARQMPLHILVNNAGVMAPPAFLASDDGIESQFATHHVGHHALTVGLLPVLEASAPSRVVVVSSGAHARAPWTGIDFANVNNAAKYHAWSAFSQSKLANVLFARELSRRLQVRDVDNVYVNVVHPGIVRTDTTTKHSHCLLMHVRALFELHVDDGARTLLYVATSDDVVTHNWHGQYFVPIARVGASDAVAEDRALGRRLWAFTEAMIDDATMHTTDATTEGTTTDETGCMGSSSSTNDDDEFDAEALLLRTSSPTRDDDDDSGDDGSIDEAATAA